MADPAAHYVHLLVTGRATDSDFTRRGGGDTKIREVERRAHGRLIQGEAVAALARQDLLRETEGFAELQSLGVVVTIEGTPGFPLRIESLERLSQHRLTAKRPKWLLLSAFAETGDAPERALVWISDEYRAEFLRLFENYLTKPARKDSEHPMNRALVANISRIEAAVVRDLWQSDGEPPTSGQHWWEIWLTPGDGAEALLERFAAALQLQVAARRLHFDSRQVMWINARWNDLQTLPHTAVPVTEIRRPQFVDTIDELVADDQIELVDDLVLRITAAAVSAPAVCLIDTGVRNSHVLLRDSLSDTDVHTVLPPPVGDVHGHGTLMAGLALFGPLDEPLLSGAKVRLRHRIESVKYLPDATMPAHDPESYGVITAQAVTLPEAASDRRRVYCMTITKAADRPGEPSLWSAALDALAAGTDVGVSASGIALLGPPDPTAARLIVVAAGNVDPPYETDHVTKSMREPIEDPAQAWNVLTVGASTTLSGSPTDPTYEGWAALAPAGELSPHSRTGVFAGGPQWPIKPDICMEGGNVLTDGAGDFHGLHPVLMLRTTEHRHDAGIGNANATSAATAQAARLAALTMAQYPSYWPETVRGLLTHHAQWTPLMRTTIEAEGRKKDKRLLLKRYGWGVPTADGVLSSTQNAVTMVVQDEFVPFDGPQYKMRQFRLHSLPWPSEILGELGDADVELRVTLSYFIEPTAARRGWRTRYAYASHGLRFDLSRPGETSGEFVRRVNHEASAEEDGIGPTGDSDDAWMIGPGQRHKGSLHQDIWSGFGSQLARSGGMLAVNAVGGWWKNNQRSDRQDLPVRYALIVSLRTPSQEVDLYTPIATELRIPIAAAMIEA